MKGPRVCLKKVKKSDHPYEEEISKYLSSEPLASDPQNHSVQILESLNPPDDADLVILVMPLLREFDSPRFDTLGEVIACFRQLFEVRFSSSPLIYEINPGQGIQFLHEHHIAHRSAFPMEKSL